MDYLNIYLESILRAVLKMKIISLLNKKTPSAVYEKNLKKKFKTNKPFDLHLRLIYLNPIEMRQNGIINATRRSHTGFCS